MIYCVLFVILYKVKREIVAKGNLKREKQPKGNLKVKREKWAKGNLKREKQPKGNLKSQNGKNA